MKLYFNSHVTFRGCMMYLTKWKRGALLLLVVMVVATCLVKSAQRFNDLKNIKRSLISDSSHGIRSMKEHDVLKRRIYSNTKELWSYVSDQLIKVMTGELKPNKIQAVVNQVAARGRSLLSDQTKLSELDGYQHWRKLEAANVSNLVQRRLHYLQNPADCKEARKLVCSMSKGCGFGCQLHHIVSCLIFAYASKRTLILRSRGWRYDGKDWEYEFYPLSKTCISTYNDKIVLWRVSQKAKVVAIRYVDLLDPLFRKPDFLPLAVPSDLAHRIARFNGDPASWWIGQMVKFVLKPRAKKQKEVNDIIATMDFKRPIVGIHVRRTDKMDGEAQFHHLEEYMEYVSEYYDHLELIQLVDVRRVYVATDDVRVLEDIRRWYPEYTFVSDLSITKSAVPSLRNTPQSLIGLLVDLELLSRCDYIVCTMSSQVGRIAYELMQTNRVDASNSLFSLDDIYYYTGQKSQKRLAVISNAGTNKDIAFGVGDVIRITGNNWNGYGLGTNTKTNANGIFPWYKTAGQLVLHNFPEYKQVPLHSEMQPDKL